MADNTTGTITCSFLTLNPDEVKYGRVVYLTSCIMATILILPSTFLNILLLKSMYASLAVRKPSTLLLYSLSVSDLMLALIQLPLYLVKKISELNDDVDLFCAIGPYSYLFGFLLSGVSLFTATAISVDRYLIIHTGIHYPQHVTKDRIIITITMIWIISISLSCLEYLVPLDVMFKLSGLVVLFCFMITIPSYFNMMLKLRKMKSEANHLSDGSAKFSRVARYQKITVTMLIVFLVFICCYLPYMCIMIVINILGSSRKGIESSECIATVITYTRSSINPIVLFWRTNEIKQAAKSTLKSVFNIH